MTDRSSIGEARRYASAAALALGFDEARRSDIAIVATEAASNVLRHAQAGEVLICPYESPDAKWLDLLALDNGPGIRDISRAFEDGYSTIGTAGQGLGAIQRLSNASSLYSLPDRGTVFWSRFENSSTAQLPSLGAVSIPIKGETLCGDGYLALPGLSRSLYMVVDGLGHGASASEAAQEAITTVRASAQNTVSEIVARTHDALKKTRGAAMSIAVADHERRILTYAGVGNITSVLVNGATTRGILSQNGTLGVVLPRIQEYTFPFESRSMLLMFSDGVSSKCSLNGYPGLQNRHPELVTGLLYRDFSRRRDDATLLFASLEGSRG